VEKKKSSASSEPSKRAAVRMRGTELLLVGRLAQSVVRLAKA